MTPVDIFIIVFVSNIITLITALLICGKMNGDE